MTDALRNVFLSYRHDDHTAIEVAARLREALQSRGMKVADSASFSPGDAIAQAIDTAVAESDAVVSILSDHVTPWSEYEGAAAVASGKRLIPIFLGSNRHLSQIFKHQVGVQLNDAKDPRFEKALGLLVEALKEPLPDAGSSVRRLASQLNALEEQRKRLETLRGRRSELVSRAAALAAIVGLVATAVSLIHRGNTGLSGYSVFGSVLPALVASVSSALGYYFGRFSKENDAAHNSEGRGAGK